ncbi:MAG: hypothetical protein NC452_19480 [Eubacterium sp.]|nr:hypothetical protein [Eubacterium sp.]
MKKTILSILLDLIFLGIFNTVFFLLGGTEHPASVWVSYSFIHFAYLMILATPLLIRKSSSAAVFGFSIYSISSAYFFVEFVVGLIFIFIRSEGFKAALVTQVIIAGIYAIVLLANLIANEKTADAIENKETEVEYIKIAASRVAALVGKSSDKKTNKAVEKAYDLLHSSPTKSISSVKSIETQVLNQISLLEEAVMANESEEIIAYSAEIIRLMEERNRKLRLSQ